MHQAVLEDRGIVRVSGPEARDFLQNLISNDMARLDDAGALYALLLSPQGKILFDFLVVAAGDDILLDCERRRAPQLVQRLTLYRLRAKVAIADESGQWRVAARWAEPDAPAEAAPGAPDRETADGAIGFIDPRLPALGQRWLVPAAAALPEAGRPTPATIADYTRHRFALGIGEGSGDLGIEALFALEANAEPLHGVDFRKGCYVGQELTARMKHRATIRKRILPATFKGAAPAPGAPVSAGKKVLGAVCAVHEDRALVLLRLDAWEEARGAGALVAAEGAALSPAIPDWLAAHLGAAGRPAAASAP